MEIYSGVSDQLPAFRASVVTVGNFDGLHLGHQKLIQTLKEEGKRWGVPTVVFTFDPHPLEVLAPELNHQRLFPREDLGEQLNILGMDYLIIEPFSKKFSQTSAQKFLEDYILKPLHPKALVVGHDFAFGADRSGSQETLKSFCMSNGISLMVLDPIQEASGIVSSSKIRQSIRLGKIREAQELLGRPYYVVGVVARGAGRGKSIGLPTVNLQLQSFILPAPGVYITEVYWDGVWNPAVSNIGCNPTFHNSSDEPQYTFETHILSFQKDLYGESLKVRFRDWLRNEIRFKSAQELISQIHKDIELAKSFFSQKESE
ncbi:MAG: bifunctional riboflavin kinase/FAD synthetase [Bdellovibrionales bacterium]|nr:bifunctional riboflavin kinase/FAD synthetase [Bdellovibrionales bacterium]